MKAIINGKRYDTEKATLIGTASSGESSSDFRYWHEKLYVTPRSKVYFVSGEGGAMSRWARRVDGNSYAGGWGIMPLTKEDAMAWAEQHLSPDAIERHFGDMLEDA